MGESLTKRRGALLVGLMCAASAFLLLLWWALLPRGTIEADIAYYYSHVQRVGEAGFRDVLPEYPLPTVIILWLPTLLTGSYAGYFAFFWVTSALMAVLVAFLLFRAGTTAATGLHAAGAWTALLTVAGPLTFFRYDLWPALCLTLALLAFGRGQVGGWSAWLASGSALKLWPALVWPLGFAGTGAKRSRGKSRARRFLAVFLLTLAAWSLVTLLVGGPGRALSPFTWQEERGLHVESVLALWVVWARALTREDLWPAALSANNSVDFTGPGVEATLAVGTALAFLFAAGVVALWIRLWRTPTNPARLTTATVSILLFLLLVNKVFSPQYIIWALPALAVLAGQQKMRGQWFAAALVSVLITGLAYPSLYGLLFGSRGPEMVIAAAALTVRAVLMIWLAVAALTSCWAGAPGYNQSNLSEVEALEGR